MQLGKRYKAGEVFNVEKGSLQSSKCVEGEYDFIVAGEDWKKHNAYTHETEALVIAVAASGSLGRTHYVNGKFIASDLCFILTPKPGFEQINLTFYYFYFNQIRADLVRDTAKGTSKLAINYESFTQYEIPVFDATYQNEIFGKLQSLQSLHREADALLARLQANVKRLRQSILQEAIQGKLVDYKPAPGEKTGAELLADIRAEKERRAREAGKKPEAPLPAITPEEVPFEVPEGWVWCRLGEVAIISTGSTPPTGNPDYYLNGDIHWVTSSQTGEEFILAGEKLITKKAVYETRLKIYPKYSLIMALYGQGKTRGQVSELLIEATINQACAAIQLILENNIHRKFIKYCLKENYNSIRQKAFGGSQPNLNGEKVKEIIIPLAPIAVQKFIIESLETQLPYSNQLEQQLAALQAQTERLWKSELQQTFKFESNG